MSVIEAYVAELSGALRGPRAMKADLLAEARDGLVDATEALRAAGLDAAGAERRAIAEFGSVARIAPDYQVQLALSQGRRTAVMVCLALGIQPIVWRVVLPLVGRVSGADSPLPGYAVVNRTVELTGALSIASALLLALAMGVGTRYLGVRGGLARTTGIFALSVAGVFTVLGTLMCLLGGQDPLGWSGLPAATVILDAPLLLVARTGRDCLTAAG